MSDICYQRPSLRLLFHLIISSKKPVVLHNGHLDLTFLYHNLYLELPNKLSSFLADLDDMFEGGIYDTKYLAEYHTRPKDSYLQYVFYDRSECVLFALKDHQTVGVVSLMHLVKRRVVILVTRKLLSVGPLA